jgi:gliding motility-associated-like protein
VNLPVVRKHSLKILFKGSIAVVVLLLMAFPGQSQQQTGNGYIIRNCPRSEDQADIWYFGDHAGIDFRSGDAVLLTNENVMSAIKSTGVICDSVGNLLFFTDGVTVWDRNFDKMPYGQGLDGDQFANQPCLIVPQPGDSGVYYIFTVDVLTFKPDHTYTTKGLEYTVINMNYRGGLGDATSRWNVPLLSPVSQKLTAVKHSNNRDFWVIAHKWDSDEFYAFLVQETGISAPVVSHAGPVVGGGLAEQTNAYGYMKASPDGHKLGLAISGKNMVELLDFDNTNGVVSNSNTFTFTIPEVTPYGFEFSSDSKKAYTSVFKLGGNGPPTSPSRVFQFDLAAGFNNPVLIDSIAGERLGDLQLAVDGRIYISRTVTLFTPRDSLDVIYNPTRPGRACNYNSLNNVAGSGFSLSGRHPYYSLPNLVQSYMNIPIFTYDSVCLHDVTRFTITNKANIDNVFWEFGDGTTSTVLEPVHAFPNSGDFTVRLTEVFNGENFTDSAVVHIHPLPVVDIGDTILLFAGNSINLHAGGGFIDYTWSTGSADSVITVENGGDYWVKVEDDNCCYNSDSVYIKFFQFYIPNAFTPNNDGLNDVFRVFSIYKNVNFKMLIYDRWGQLIFESNNIDQGWDGTIGGKPCPPDSYIYTCTIGFIGEDIITSGNINYKGSVILVR